MIQLALLAMVALVNLLLSFFVFLKGIGKKVNLYFSATIFATVLWSTANYLADHFAEAGLEVLSTQYTRLTFWGSALVAPFFLMFVLVFPREKKPASKKLTTFIFLSFLFISYFILATPHIVDSVQIVGNHVNIINGGLYVAYIIFFIGYLGPAFYLLLKKYRKSTGIEKQQIQYLFLGTFLAAFFASTTNLVLPLLTGNYAISKYGPYFTVFLIGFTTYSIIRHRLLDIRLVISRSVLYLFLVLSVSLVFTLSIFLTSRFFQELGGARIFITILSSFIVVIGLDPLKKFIGKQTDRFFFKAPINYQEVLTALSERISVEVDLDALVLGLPKDLERDLKVKHVEILLMDEQGNLCQREASTGRMQKCLIAQNPLVVHIERPGKTIDRDGLERKIEDTRPGPAQELLRRSLHQMEELDAYFVAPVTTQGKLNAALVLSQKLSGDAFSTEELALFKVLGPQIGSAIEKAKLFDEVKNFTQKLQIEVDRATKELKERNRFLLALQDITSLITHSLDYKRVTQEIVDGIARKLGYIGGILMLTEKDTGKTWAEAITDTAVTRGAMKLLPKPVSEYFGNVTDPDLASLSVRTGEVQQSEKLEEFLHPPIPVAICKAIQKLTRIKHVVSVPIFSEDEVIGALVFVIGKQETDLTDQELAMMKSLADQAGIVIRNLRLFQAIQKANGELEEANNHLRSLDQAKSEFISIASHQLRTPMTGIMGYLSMLVGGDFGKFDPGVSKILEGILGASKRMIRLINIFLNISKIEAGRFEITKKPTQVSEVIETEFIELSKLAKDKGLKLIFEKPKQALAQANVDRDKIADVIQNLVDNAIKYTDKGTVTVHSDVRGDEFIVAVVDSGRGIKKEEVDKLFNKFVRGDGIARIHPDGSGLGLYIAKKIVEAHGGRIWVESEGEGKGSTFSFAVPLT